MYIQDSYEAFVTLTSTQPCYRPLYRAPPVCTIIWNTLSYSHLFQRVQKLWFAHGTSEIVPDPLFRSHVLLLYLSCAIYAQYKTVRCWLDIKEKKSNTLKSVTYLVILIDKWRLCLCRTRTGIFSFVVILWLCQCITYSTYVVFVCWCCGYFFDSTDAVFPHKLQAVDEYYNMASCSHLLTDGYSQSKWVAEQLVLRAMERGLPATVYRLGTTLSLIILV